MERDAVSIDDDEDYYFEINLTRSQLSDLICRNEDCEAAQLFALKNIGPLVPKELKDPYVCYEYHPPPPRKETRNVEVQSPKKFPCGHRKCKYLKVYPDKSSVGYRNETCTYSKKICDNPTCVYSKYPVKAVCSECGGYSVSGKTCKDIQKEGQKENIHAPPQTICHEECKPPDPKKKALLIAPASLLPFDQLQAAARKERLQTMEKQFKLAIEKLGTTVMDAFEKHFNIFNPHVHSETANRGEVWANNNFYNFYIDTTRYTIEMIRELLLDIWNQSVATKKATIKEQIKINDTLSDKLISPTENVTSDLVDYIINNFGMKSSKLKFHSYVYSVITNAVLLNKNNIPPDRIPSSPNLSVTDSEETKKIPSMKKIYENQLSFNFDLTKFHTRVTHGHKYCIPHFPRGPPVPRDMGWLWNLGEQIGTLVPRRYYKPGAVPRVIAQIIKSHKIEVSSQQQIVKKKKVTVSESQIQPMLSVYKKQGEYLIRVIPHPNPYWPFEQNKEYAPMLFLISKNRNKIEKINRDGTKETILECDCQSESESSTEEFQIEYIPPIQVVDPIEASRLPIKNPKKGFVDCEVQCNIRDKKGKNKAKEKKRKEIKF